MRQIIDFLSIHRLTLPSVALPLIILSSGCAHLSQQTEPDSPSIATETTEVKVAPETQPTPSGSEENTKTPSLEIPQSTLESLLVAEFAGQRRDFSTALNTYMTEARQTGLPSVAKRALQIAQYAADNEKIAEAAQLWSEADPAAVEPHRQLAGMYISEQNFPAALAEFHEVYLMTRSSHYELLASTVALESRENQLALFNALEELAFENRYIPNIWTALGMVAQTLEMDDVALSSFNSALEADSNAILPASLKARLLAQDGDQERALEWVQQVLEKHPDNKGMRLLQGRLLLRLNRLEEARDLFSSINQQHPEDATVLLSLGLIEFDLGDFPAASHHLNELLATGQHQSEALYYSGIIALRSGDTDRAFSLLKQVPAGEEFLDAHHQAARLLLDSEGIYQARLYLQEKRISDPQYEVPLTRIEARLLMEQKQFVDAMKLYTDALSNEPENTELLYSRAMLAGQMGKMQILENDLKQVILLDPNNADALNALGYTLLDGHGRYDEAEPLLEKALTLSPNNPAIIDSIGWLHFLRGEYDLAEPYLKRAFEIVADHEISAHYGELLWVTGRTEKAMQVWNTGLIDNPNSYPIRSTMERLSVKNSASTPKAEQVKTDSNRNESEHAQ